MKFRAGEVSDAPIFSFETVQGWRRERGGGEMGGGRRGGGEGGKKERGGRREEMK